MGIGDHEKPQNRDPLSRREIRPRPNQAPAQTRHPETQDPNSISMVNQMMPQVAYLEKIDP
jgi:hypothetical protein